MQTALIVEDDQLLAQTLKQVAWRQGLKPILTHHLFRARNLLEEQEFALLILDRVLPDGDGFDLIQPALDHYYQTKILVLTYQAETEQKIEGLTLGADEYLAKPFSQQELVLRLKNLLAQQKIVKPHSLSYRNFILYPSTGKVIIDDQEKRLRPKQAGLLACLIQHRGLIVTHQMIFDYVWGHKRDWPNKETLAVYIRRLRIKLGAAGSQVQTVRKVGYRLI